MVSWRSLFMCTMGRQRSCNFTFYCWLSKWKVKVNQKWEKITVKSHMSLRDIMHIWTLLANQTKFSPSAIFFVNVLDGGRDFSSIWLMYPLLIYFIQRTSEKSSRVRINATLKKLFSDWFLWRANTKHNGLWWICWPTTLLYSQGNSIFSPELIPEFSDVKRMYKESVTWKKRNIAIYIYIDIKKLLLIIQKLLFASL